MTAPSQALDLTAVAAQVDAVLSDFLDSKTHTARATHMPTDLPHAIRGFLDAGGKRLRPLLCVIGWHTGGGHGDTAPIVQAAAALEMFHVFGLIHDDIIDSSTIRRGHLTVHHALAARYPGEQGHDALRWGTSGAILAGDMALAWSDELLHTAGYPPARLTAAQRVIDAMREEVIYGQYLDLQATHRSATDLDAALRVIRYKTAKYTCERPLHTGAALAGASPALHEALTAFALPLGDAFQLRDDLLGVYGNPEETGKADLDDLREGKHTVLLALASQRATTAERAVLTRLIGNPRLDDAGAEKARSIITATGARNETEQMIENLYGQAVAVLDNGPFHEPALSALRDIAARAAWRTK